MISNSRMTFATRCVLAASLAASLAVSPARPALGQSLKYLSHTKGYFAIGGGSGSHTLTCGDPACTNRNQSGSAATLLFGWHIGQRFRLEGGGFTQRNANDFQGGATIGAAAYVIDHVYVRGSYAKLRATSDDVSGSYSGDGGGYLIGAGYDLFLGRVFTLSPYVSAVRATLPSIQRTLSGTTTTSGGTAKVLQFGLTLGYVGGVWECTTSRGERVTVQPNHRYKAESCLNEVQQRLDR